MDILGWFKDEVYATQLEPKGAHISVPLKQGKMQDVVESEGSSMSFNEHCKVLIKLQMPRSSLDYNIL